MYNGRSFLAFGELTLSADVKLLSILSALKYLSKLTPFPVNN